MNPRRPAAGFSLIELLTVVLIVGILAGIATPKLMGQSDEVDVAATVQHLRAIALAAEMFNNDRGSWPSDAAGGNLPAQLANYLRPNLFAVACPAGGGSYDWDRDRLGVKAAIKIVAPTPSADQMLAIDQAMDDGNLATGFVVNVNGFKLILER